MGAFGPDSGAGGLALVTAEVVEDDDVARRQGRRQYFLDVDEEDRAVDRTIDNPGRVDPVMAQGGVNAGANIRQLAGVKMRQVTS